MISKQPSSDSRQHIIDVGQQIISTKGFSAVGLAEILAAAAVPKGSFYHYFPSKEAFGVAMLESYFACYAEDMEAILADATQRPLDRLLRYWEVWSTTQGGNVECARKCLAVKLGSEVSDLSDSMRQVLQRGTRAIIDRLAQALAQSIAAGEINHSPAVAQGLAETLYELWLGASLMAKITHASEPLLRAFETTKRLLHIQ
jgi:TetR/AcrR family transcriptional repressor of nem operon